MHDLTPSRSARLRALSLGILITCSVACGKSTSAPEKEPSKEPPVTAPTAAPSASAASAERAAPKVVPSFVLERFAPEGTNPEGVFAIEGAIVVTEKQRVGRIVGDSIEWVREKIPPVIAGVGETVIDSVHGRWPDAIDVLYRSDNGRAPVPSYLPLTGKGTPLAVAAGGGAGWMTRPAEVGESVLLFSYGMDIGYALWTVRGPKLGWKQQSPGEAKCKPGEVENFAAWLPPPPAIPSSAIVGTRDGTLVSVGNLCEKRGPAAEIWDAAGKSRIVDLTPWVKDLGYWPTLLRGKDALFLYSGKDNPILQYRNGEFTPIARPAEPVSLAFLSTSGQLHVIAGLTIQRHDDGKWLTVGHLPWPVRYRNAVVDGETIWASTYGTVYKLREGSGTAYRDDCKTPFVYLYDVSADNAKDFTFPSTRKALATFAGAGEIGLVEVNESGRRLGVTVTSKEQGEAVIAHVKTSMKDEAPVLLCYEPKNPRKIELKPKGK